MLTKILSLGLSKLLVISLGILLLAGGAVMTLGRRPTQPKVATLTSPSPLSSPVLTPSPEASPTVTSSPVVKSTPSSKPATTKSPEASPSSQATPTASSSSSEPLIQHLGFNLGYYDAATGRAGDFRFTQATLHENRIWTDYGHTITQTNTGSAKRNPQPTFILPMGTKVRSLVDGKVTNVQQLYSNDYSIQVQRAGNTNYTYETEHVLNPTVKVGDTVTAGQEIAEVSSHDSQYNEGMGLFEIGILAPSANEAQHVCPFAYLDPSIKSDIQNKIKALYKSWEEYRGADFYDDGSYPLPGCQLLDPIAG